MTDLRPRPLAFLLAPLALAGLLVVAAGALGDPSSAAEPQPRPCAAPEHRQFDFWIGDWDVATPDGTVRGRNVIEAIEGGCALRETYTTGRGYGGTSLNFYDVARGGWHQTWIDNQGSPLHLDGGLDGDRMVLRGEAGSALQRITWTPLADGRVRQHWESSSDGGASWTTAFDGYYRRRP
jgi:hypothetical protein